MKIHVLVVALGAAVSLPLPALAAGSQQQSGGGHYEWRTVPPFGPRSVGLQKRVWVPDETASCDSAMMKMAPADCMKHMHGVGRHTSGASAG